MRRQDPRVPPEVEDHLVNLNAAAGELGGRIGGALGGALAPAGASAAGAGGRGGARGGAFGARMLKTKVEERSGTIEAEWGQIVDRLLTGLADADSLSRDRELVRLSVPWGRTGLQRVIVDLQLCAHADHAGRPTCDVRLRAFCKEGLVNRNPTATTADQAWQAITGRP